LTSRDSICLRRALSVGPRPTLLLVERIPPQRLSQSAAKDAVEAARQWLTLLLIDRNVAAAWQLTAPDYRLALMQAIVFLNEQAPALAGYEHSELAAQLATETPDHPLWTSFADLIVEEFLVDLGETDPDDWSTATSTPTDPGYELVLFGRGGAGEPGEPPEMQVRGVLVKRHGDRWLVAGLSRRPATPGWPPDLGY
jgi:hypothetical protein